KEVLDDLSDRYGLVFRINETAFKFDNINEVWKTEVANPEPIPPRKARLATVLQTILARVQSPSGAAYLFRKDHVEITTNDFVQGELGRPTDPNAHQFPDARQFIPHPERSLMWDAFEDTPVAHILQRIADDSGLNVVTDSRVAKNLQLKVT